jgi:hypothetical protein
MIIRTVWVALASLLVLAGTASAQPGTAYIQGHGGAMIPVGDYSDRLDVGGGYSIVAGYEFIEFLDMQLSFTHTFNDTDEFTYTAPTFTAFSEEVAQTFVVGMGPRINFMSSDYRVRPYMTNRVGWYHIATRNSIEVDGIRILDDTDRDAVGIAAGLGLEGTILEVTERRGDRYPMLELTMGIEGTYHHAFITGTDDAQFVTAMGTFGLRF